MLVRSDDAKSVAQQFLQIERQLRHYAQQCESPATHSSGGSRSESSTDTQLVSPHRHGYLFASEHDLSSESGDFDAGSSNELPELDLPFRPLDVEDSVHDMQVCLK